MLPTVAGLCHSAGVKLGHAAQVTETKTDLGYQADQTARFHALYFIQSLPLLAQCTNPFSKLLSRVIYQPNNYLALRSVLWKGCVGLTGKFRQSCEQYSTEQRRGGVKKFLSGTRQGSVCVKKNTRDKNV